MKVKSLSHVQLFVTPRTVAYKLPPFMGFSRQEYWSGFQGILPTQRLNPVSCIADRHSTVWATREAIKILLLKLHCIDKEMRLWVFEYLPLNHPGFENWKLQLIINCSGSEFLLSDVCVCVCMCAKLFQLFLQARIPEWVAMPSYRGYSQPRDQTCFP